MDIQSLYEIFKQTGSVSTDTRQIIPGSIFFALKGPTYNANLFAAEALEKGARLAIVDQADVVKTDRYVLVGDVLNALQDLACHHRDQLKIPVIGLTGSNGKTTTKELLHAVLSTKFKTKSTKGNLNNHIGVPLTILGIDETVEIAVIEMGANHVGEIAALSEIAKPTHGLITNIGKGHIGMFGGFENIIRAKSELYQYLLSHGGQVFINSQNPILSNMAKRFAHPLFYPASGDYYSCELESADPYVVLKTSGDRKIFTKLPGSYNFENLAAALCLAKFFEINEQQSAQAISEYIPSNMRSQIIQGDNNVVILDAYNANPSSMAAAITNLSQMKAARKAVILGDMYELGEESEQEHRNLGRLLKEKQIDAVYLCGKLIQPATEYFPTAVYFESKEALTAYLKAHPIRQTTILVKASRGMGLETILDLIS